MRYMYTIAAYDRQQPLYALGAAPLTAAEGCACYPGRLRLQ